MVGDDDSKADTVPADGATSDTTSAAATQRPAKLSLSSYEIREQPIGRGGMGEVLLARDPQIGRDVAIKRMTGDDQDPEAVIRFVREAKIQAQLEHPAIVPVHEIGSDANGHPYFTMKRLTGRTLLDVLRDPEVRQQRLLRALVGVCNAIELAHSRAIIHRDLKPANIMLGDYGEVYVLDWGIARVLAAPDGTTAPGIPISGETQVGAVMGTLGYMAPEQLRDASSAGPAADVYALGCILYEILAGVPVHPRAEAMITTLADHPRSPAARAPDRDIPPELDAACTRALAFEPADRLTVRELGHEIESYLDGDRDLEHRRALSVEHLAAATAALGDPTRRADAAREAGRALALDPASPAAGRLVRELMLELPTVLPAELEDHLDELDRAASRRAAGAAVWLMLAFFAIMPLLVWNGITSWPWLVGLMVTMIVSVAGAYMQTRWKRPNDYFALAAAMLMCIELSRFGGVFVITTPVIIVALTGLGQQAAMIRHPSILVGGGLMAAALPLLLEQVGVFDKTVSIEGGHVVISSSILELHGTSSFVVLLVPTLMLVLSGGLFARWLGGERREALRNLEIRAWHMEHVIGEAAAARS